MERKQIKKKKKGIEIKEKREIKYRNEANVHCVGKKKKKEKNDTCYHVSWWTCCAQYAPVGSNAMGPDAFRSTGDATATWIARITATRLDAASAPPPPLPLRPPLSSPPRSWRSPSWRRTPSPSRPCIAGRKDVCRRTTSATGWWTVLGVRMNDIAVSKPPFLFASFPYDTIDQRTDQWMEKLDTVLFWKSLCKEEFATMPGQVEWDSCGQISKKESDK